MKQLSTLLCLFLFFAVKAQDPKVIKQVVVAEYRTWYITQDGKIWAYNNNSALPVQFPIGGLKADTGVGGFNYFRIIDEQGYVWTSKIDLTVNSTRIDKDATGAPFNGNRYIDAYGDVAMTIRSDGSVWYFGKDVFSLFYKGGDPLAMTGTTMAPTQLSPAGWKFRKVLFAGDRILGLTTSGQVYQWTSKGNRTPDLIQTPRSAIDIFASRLSAYGCIIPDADGQTAGWPYIWGGATSMWGGKGSYNKPTSVKDLWKMTAPIKEISMDWNTIHYIDNLGNMYGCGFNSFGEVGNGQEFINKYNYPGFPGYGWTFTDYENPSGIPVQIGKGVKWKHLYSNNWFGFYKYAMAENDDLYSWGRNKSLTLGNGLWNGYDGGASHPNELDVLTPTMVHPLTAIFTEYGFIPPTISAGPNQTVAGPVVTLKGSARAMLAIAVRKPAPNGIDTAGYKIVSYQWKQVSGPKGATITSPNAATTSVTGLQKGSYVFNLLTTDNNTGTLSANTSVQVTANSSDEVVANAGTNQTLTLPTNSTTLTGVTQTTGTIASIKWTQTSGPSAAAIGTPAKAQTTVGSLIQGVYKFQLQVTTLLGTIALATVQVTVNPAPVVAGPPVANAGADQTITLPMNSITLTGSGSETNGSITGYKWSQTSGPSNATLATPTQTKTTAGGLVAGTYVFQLTIADKKGATASDKVNVVVKPAPVTPPPPPPPPSATPPPPVYLSIPGTIQAEAYSQKKGAGVTAPENASDEGGGKDIGLLKLGDEVTYNVNVATSGAYSMTVRVATPFDGASFQLQDAKGYVLVTAGLPNTGGGQIWKTLSLRVNLPAGKQTLKLVSQTAYGWNFNWMQFSFLTAATVNNIPGIIQAGDYDNTVGAALETTLDTGGGQDAGLGENDQLNYRVNVNASGAYTVSFRVASPYSGAGFRLMDGKGKTLATIAVPNTGGWQLWKTVSATVSLAAGQQQTLVIVSQKKDPWNVHWMQFEKQTKDISADAAATAATKGQAAHFNVYPNPAIDQVTLDIANPYIGRLNVQVIDGNGAVIRTSELNKGLPVIQAPISLSGLAPGLYMIQVRGTGWSAVQKIMKK
ncbi:MAG TPA: carbohydrate-binding protein [Puia sp.]|nr:carbohydrate-binding protein [Puia sp.]